VDNKIHFNPNEEKFLKIIQTRVTDIRKMYSAHPTRNRLVKHYTIPTSEDNGKYTCDIIKTRTPLKEQRSYIVQEGSHSVFNDLQENGMIVNRDIAEFKISDPALKNERTLASLYRVLDEGAGLNVQSRDNHSVYCRTMNTFIENVYFYYLDKSDPKALDFKELMDNFNRLNLSTSETDLTLNQLRSLNGRSLDYDITPTYTEERDEKIFDNVYLGQMKDLGKISTADAILQEYTLTDTEILDRLGIIDAKLGNFLGKTKIPSLEMGNRQVY
jgi:hypothetical protein